MRDDGGEDREPLLVRPFVLQDDGGSQEAPASAATWPADPTRETPTQVIPPVPGAAPATAKPRDGRRRTPLLLIGAGVAAVLAVVAYAVVHPALRPAVSTSLPDRALPVVTGPAPSAGASTAGGPAGPPPGNDATGADRGGAVETTRGAPGTSASPSATTPSATPTTATTTTTTTAASAPASRTTSAPPAELVPPSPLISSDAALVSGNGLCLDLQGGAAGDGVAVHIDDCNGTSPQRWRLNSDRTLEVLDMCAYLVGSGGVELVSCDNRTTAQWTFTENGQVTNAANGQCLTDPYYGARPGKQVIVSRCVGTSNQRWSFR